MLKRLINTAFRLFGAPSPTIPRGKKVSLRGTLEPLAGIPGLLVWPISMLQLPFGVWEGGLDQPNNPYHFSLRDGGNDLSSYSYP
jgi:hypothetical protein